MRCKLCRRIEDESGFTLIELLVVILIIGILAAIAIPSFLNQTSKAKDASAKELVRSAQTAAETYATDHGGSYSGMNAAALNQIEPTIPVTSSSTNAFLVSATPDGANLGYSVVTQSVDGNTYTITRGDDGTIRHTCNASVSPGNGGCVNDTW
jgi:type IV pilus assembly protein PilA